jgi:hypothetical protein
VLLARPAEFELFCLGIAVITQLRVLFEEFLDSAREFGSIAKLIEASGNITGSK